jgi:hypothetical protein
MNIFDMEVYARRCEKSQQRKIHEPGTAGYLRNHFRGTS